MAKSPFRGAAAIRAYRRQAGRLFVTAAGVSALAAATAVVMMPGAHPLPDMLRQVDRLART